MKYFTLCKFAASYKHYGIIVIILINPCFTSYKKMKPSHLIQFSQNCNISDHPPNLVVLTQNTHASPSYFGAIVFRQ